MLSFVFVFALVMNTSSFDNELLKNQDNKAIKIENQIEKSEEYTGACEDFSVAVFVAAIDDDMSLEDAVDLGNNARLICEVLVLIGRYL